MKFWQQVFGYLKIDTHAALHFVGCFGIAMSLFKAGAVGLPGFLIAVVFGLAWEILDAMNQTYGWQIPVLDPNGGDLIDFLWDIGGGLLAVLFWTIL